MEKRRKDLAALPLAALVLSILLSACGLWAPRSDSSVLQEAGPGSGERQLASGDETTAVQSGEGEDGEVSAEGEETAASSKSPEKSARILREFRQERDQSRPFVAKRRKNEEKIYSRLDDGESSGASETGGEAAAGSGLQEAEDGAGDLLYDVPHGSWVEEEERHLFWRRDEDSFRRAVSEEIYRGLLRGDTQIELGAAFEDRVFTVDPIDVVATLFYSVRDTDPRFFFYKADFKYEYTWLDKKKGGYVFPSYTLFLEIKPGMEQESRRRQALEEMNAKVWEIADGIAAEEETLLGRYEAAYEYVAKNSFYSPTRDYDTNNAYSAVMKRETMCVGYALFFQMLANRLGGDVITVYGYTDATEAGGEADFHNWNMARLGDRWYHLDLAWDDQSSEGGSEIDDPSMLPGTIYFMRAESQIPDHEVWSYGAPYAAEDLEGLWPELHSFEELSKKARECFASYVPAEGKLQLLQLEYTLDKGNMDADALNALITQAYYDAAVSYEVRWIFNMQYGRFYLYLTEG